MKITILALENPNQTAAVADLLQTAGHAYVICESLKAVLDCLRTAPPDLLVVFARKDTSTSFPEWVGHIKRVSEVNGRSLPVLGVIDVGNMDAQALAELHSAGLDDYLVQPVRRAELTMRINVLLHRTWPEKMRAAQLQFGPFLFDTNTRRVFREGQMIVLAHKEFELALLFFRHFNQPLSRTTLLETLWTPAADRPSTSDSRTVDTHVSRVRNKLGLESASGFRLVPVYGYGYVLEAARKVEAETVRPL